MLIAYKKSPLYAKNTKMRPSLTRKEAQLFKVKKCHGYNLLTKKRWLPILLTNYQVLTQVSGEKSLRQHLTTVLIMKVLRKEKRKAKKDLLKSHLVIDALPMVLGVGVHRWSPTTM